MKKILSVSLLILTATSCKVNNYQEWKKPTKHHVDGVIDTTWTGKVGPFKLHWIKVNDSNIYVQDTTLEKGMRYESYLKRIVR